MTARRSPFTVLSRTFFAQFFSNETVTSDEQLRQTIIWVVAFLLTPGIMMLMRVMPAYRVTVLRAGRLKAPWLIDQMLASLAAVWVTFAIVGVGLVAVFVWDALSFDRRDAMVLGPLPIPGRTIVAAKLGALAALLLFTAAAVNLTTGLPYALATGSEHGLVSFVRQLLAHMIGTMLAATFIFTTIVTIRGVVSLAGGARLAARMGAALQFFFVAAIICVVAMTDSGRPVQSPTGWRAWLPTMWFLGLLEHLRGSPRVDFEWLGERGLIAVAVSTVSCVIVSMASFRRQFQLALAPAAFVGPLGTARLSRTLAGWMVLGKSGTRAMTDFILLTIARNRAQQSPIAMNAAIGMAIVIIALEQRVDDVASLMQPRTVVLWIPLILAYWAIIGMRAAFFLPSELPASWTFRAHAGHQPREQWRAIRASIVALVAPPVIGVALLLTPLVGWPMAAWHAVLVLLLVILMADLIALTIDHIPFTRPYPPGHAKLRTRWPFYLLGMFAFARWTVWVELKLLDHVPGLLAFAGVLVSAIVALEMVARRVRGRTTTPPEEDLAEAPWAVTTLNISGA